MITENEQFGKKLGLLKNEWTKNEKRAGEKNI